MSIKTDQAIAKMTAECQEKEFLIPFEEYLTEIMNDKIADKVMKEDKTLKGSFEEMKKIARKRAVDNCAYIPNEEGYEIIKTYFGITDDDIKQKSAPADVIDITDLL